MISEFFYIISCQRLCRYAEDTMYSAAPLYFYVLRK